MIRACLTSIRPASETRTAKTMRRRLSVSPVRGARRFLQVTAFQPGTHEFYSTSAEPWPRTRRAPQRSGAKGARKGPSGVCCGIGQTNGLKICSQGARARPARRPDPTQRPRSPPLLPPNCPLRTGTSSQHWPHTNVTHPTDFRMGPPLPDQCDKCSSPLPSPPLVCGRCKAYAYCVSRSQAFPTPCRGEAEPYKLDRTRSARLVIGTSTAGCAPPCRRASWSR